LGVAFDNRQTGDKTLRSVGGLLSYRGDSLVNGQPGIVIVGGVVPANDNAYSIGVASRRFSVIYAGSGTINTSDANTKQNIDELSIAEKRVAIRIKSLVKKFRFKDAVENKGASARIHVGVIAQEVRDAFTVEGLDANRYAMFCEDTWYEVNGRPTSEDNKEQYTEQSVGAVKVTRLGIRYDELFAFVIGAM
jgi:hypothetical protein